MSLLDVEPFLRVYKGAAITGNALIAIGRFSNKHILVDIHGEHEARIKPGKFRNSHYTENQIRLTQWILQGLNLLAG